MSGEIQLIERENINVERWNELVNGGQASVYNQIHYLDSLSENWSAVVFGDYEGAMAIPYSVRLGVKGMYTPNFIRAIDWMGKKPEKMAEIEQLLKHHFKRANLNINQQFFSGCEEKVYQVLENETAVLIGSQTKRGIKKFEKTGLVIEQMDIESVLPLIVSELREKVKDLNDQDFKRFEKLLLNYDKKNCLCYGIKGETIHAAIILIEWNNEILYIKGGVDEFGKQNGLMHALMFDAITNTFKQRKTFSFEGSFVPSVRQFNLGFGATDKVYYTWKWDSSPWWFKLLLKFR